MSFASILHAAPDLLVIPDPHPQRLNISFFALVLLATYYGFVSVIPKYFHVILIPGSKKFRRSIDF